MVNRYARGASFVALGLGALGGCHEPADPTSGETEALFQSDARRADSLGGETWRQYLRANALHRAWVPSYGSPWRPYYRPTLPAAVSIVASAAQPLHRDNLSTEARIDELARKIDLSKVALFVDLPGEESVDWGARLADRGLQPVATFNNWPHPRGVLKLERPLGALIYYAAGVETTQRGRGSGGRPVFLLEGTRLLNQSELGPDVFDNRYFHVASDFPTAEVLTGQGIRTIVYVRNSKSGRFCEDDLLDYFVDLHRSGLAFQHVTVEPGFINVLPWSPEPRNTIFTPELTRTFVTTSRVYGRSYGHYRGFWSSHQGTWGGGSSGGGGGGGFS